MIIILFIIICAVAFGFMMSKVIYQAHQCTANPFVYGINHIVDKNGDTPQSSCQCQVGSIGNFYFDNEGAYKENPLLNSNTLKLDFNDIG